MLQIRAHHMMYIYAGLHVCRSTRLSCCDRVSYSTVVFNARAVYLHLPGRMRCGQLCILQMIDGGALQRLEVGDRRRIDRTLPDAVVLVKENMRDVDRVDGLVAFL